ncbi:MAG: cob(I)yrinic acid a,c-diamide adenosyltransferase [Deltaproteobacteria bacterium]|nr:cob(I)yrinic acid a,c-diamide adenosyltransferase [Deltaproteobacteria bacterium]
MAKIYTKTGDDGTTALFDGTRVKKDHQRIGLYGEVDELNSIIGLAESFITDPVFKKDLYQIQRDLLALGANLANPGGLPQADKTQFNNDKVEWLENKIDEMQAGLEPLGSFILPGGSHSAGCLQVARCVCRRAERVLVSLLNNEKTDGVYLVYLNRLSDFLFLAARHANKLRGEDEIEW